MNGPKGVGYCLCGTMPPTQMDGTDSPVAPYRVNARSKTMFSAAKAFSAGVNVFDGL